MIDGTNCHLIYDGQTVASKHRKHIRDHRRTKELKTYIKQKTGMSEAAFADIDWQSHEHSVNTFKDGPHIFLLTFLHGWLPVGKLVSRYNLVKYASACLSCDEPVEDSNKHVANGMRPLSLFLDTDPALLGPPPVGPEPLAPSNQGVKTRNKARHGKDAEDKAQRRLEKSHRTIRDLYDLKPKCSLQAQRHYFYPTVEDHFRTDPDASSLENWLETYEPMIKQNIRHRRNNSNRRLRQIDEVFQLTRTVPPHNQTPTIVPRQRTPTITTRPINTYFLPHRITFPTPTLETTTTTARTTSTSNNPTTSAPRPP
ncbi:hypothetical protein IV203_019917 [Nitzschia inconspicua]|uniref:Uncharacterized protein n=1 Tax=Nitzschia inconspicua TaxID=303405 RepID=A0A9K3M037_9STRA|nr:hypothetical protein IV203_019917 [Nitzschia inconspicua]